MTILKTSRRSFIKGAGMLACTPLITSALYAGESSSKKKGSLHRILCCNIRVDLPVDDEAGVGWKDRKGLCISIIRKHKPDIIGFQEVLRNQNEDMKKAFPDFFSFGFEGPEMDEFTEGYHGIAKNPIFFSKKRYELLSAGGFWLSETPLVAGSKSWDTNRARQANWVRLRDKKTGKDFRVVNLHLDHKSQPARVQQTNMVLEEASQYPAEYPQILIGDFNSSAANAVYENIKTAGWTDTYTAIHGNAEPGYTTHAFKGENYERKDLGKKIDFIFVKGDIKSQGAEILKDNVNGVYPSDHYFVAADIQMT